ncbi:porin family protein [Bacteroides sp. AN502(2024)]|uniref:porin family protein n=1 Tax=Bacteroides sp. AN502(2024) TaxID=3160599 RepID=UPI003515701F
MKKGLIFVLFALVSIVSYSQISWNAKVGMNMSNLSGLEESSMKVGFNVGVGMEYQFTEMWSIQPSLMFSAKGAKQDFSQNGEKYESTYSPMYLELPIMAAARFAVAENQNIVVKAGPYLAYGIGGKVKNSWSDGEESAEVKYDIFKDTKDEDGDIYAAAKKFDLGIGVGVAYEINKFFVDLTGSFGLTKLCDGINAKGEKTSVKNMNFSIGVGYKF